MPDGAEVQSIMGPPQGHIQARDETVAEAEDVRLFEGLRRANHHPQDRPPQNHQQVSLPYTGLVSRTPRLI